MSNAPRPDRRQIIASGAALALTAQAAARAAEPGQIKMFDAHLHLISNDRVAIDVDPVSML